MKLNQINRVTTPFGDFQVDVDNLVDQIFGDGGKPTSGKTWTPRVSVLETEAEYQMTVELPGVEPADVTLEMEEGRLEISGEKKIAEPAEGVTSFRDERLRGRFKRTFDFAKQVEPDDIEAEFKNGLLQIVLPKSAKVLPRKIKIKVGESGQA